eukprot:TRINITY_DN14745_c0_g2_i1.p2 TRINITY_DN14745_c0_g2~~TRINITY_DN14745_c0_g2_i1.p2  ORF type:complete len:176 (-),score=32.07 TRINITY_DN14745_c0_g2_i1:151-678(-)
MRPLQEGDIVNVDITIFLRGYHGDVSETYPVGAQSKSSLELVKTAYESMHKAIEICKPDTPFKAIGEIIGSYADSKGLAVVRDYTGHGVGKLFHSEPSVPHYPTQMKQVMRPGHVFTIEPMISQGTYKIKEWPDKWTVATVDGQRSAQFEHTILITEDGHEILTARNENSPALNI